RSNPTSSPLPDLPLLQAHLLAILTSIAQSSPDENLRVKAALGALNITTRLQRNHLAAQRLDLAREHLELLKAKDQRAQETHQLKLQAHPEPDPDDPERPLTPGEIADIQDLLPHIGDEYFQRPHSPGWWRGEIINQRYWKAYWEGWNKCEEDFQQKQQRQSQNNSNHSGNNDSNDNLDASTLDDVDPYLADFDPVHTRHAGQQPQQQHRD